MGEGLGQSVAKDIDIDRLGLAHQRSREALKPFRAARLRVLKKLAGPHYSDRTVLKKRYLNLISLYLSIVPRDLVPKNHRVMMSTFDHDQKPAVSAMNAWANDEIERLGLGAVYKELVVDACIQCAIAKVSIATPADVRAYGGNVPAGSPMLSKVDLDDFVFDTQAKKISEAAFIGNRFRVAKSVVLDSKLYSSRAKKRLEASLRKSQNFEGDEQATSLVRGDETVEFEDMVDLWEIYFPQHKCVYTIADADIFCVGDGRATYAEYILREQEWIGPECGPYFTLQFNPMPGNPMPRGTINDVVELDTLANNLYRKLGDQAERVKEILLVPGSSDQDAERIVKTQDGKGARCEDPSKVKAAVFGGLNQGLFVFARDVIERFKEMSGNLSTWGGLSQQANTATQEQLLAQQSGGLAVDMRDTVYQFISDTQKALGWFWWHDPHKVMESTYSVPQAPEISMTRKLHPWNHDNPEDLRRDGPMPKIKVDPYSLIWNSPERRAKDLVDVVTQVYTPLAQLAERQGVALDLVQFLQQIAELKDMPDLATILTMVESQQQQTDQSAGVRKEGTMPPETTRNYNRISSGGKTAEQGAMDSLWSSDMSKQLE